MTDLGAREERRPSVILRFENRGAAACAHCGPRGTVEDLSAPGSRCLVERRDNGPLLGAGMFVGVFNMSRTWEGEESDG